MKYYRYGKFNFSDYYGSWFSILLLLTFSVGSIILDLSPLFVFFPLVYAIIWISALLIPQCERFILNDDSIIVLFGKKTYTISLPSELTLIVSYADICPPLTVRTVFGNQTHILKNKFAISIFRKMPENNVLEKLHQPSLQKYTSSGIKIFFNDFRYIYSFVCNQSLFDKLIANRKCMLIIPESLSGVLSVNSNSTDVIIDFGY